MIELHAILILMIIGAVAAVGMEDLLSSVIVFTAVGVCLALEFLFLRAPEVAIIQLACGVISLIILIKIIQGAQMPLSKRKFNVIYIIFALFFVAAFLYFSYQALLGIPRFGSSIMKIGQYYIDEGLHKTGAANIVAAVMFDFRAYDALAAIAVVFASVIGTMAVLRTSTKKD